MGNKAFLSIIIITIISGIISSPANALQLTNTVLNTDTYYQGDNGVVTVTLYNDNTMFQWNIKSIWIQFDWMLSDNSHYQAVVDQNIVSGGTGTYNVSFSIPSSASIGNHKFTLYYVGLYGDVNQLGLGSIYIHDINERNYNNLLQQVYSNLQSATNSNYQSPDAISDLNQAHMHVSQAQTYASQGQFVDGINELHTANNFLSQASSVEKSYHPPLFGGSGGSNSGYSTDYSGYVIIALIIGAGAGAIVFALKRGKNIHKKMPSLRQNKKRLDILKDRLAHGEITKEEYDQLKKEFE